MVIRQPLQIVSRQHQGSQQYGLALGTPDIPIIELPVFGEDRLNKGEL